MRTRFFWTVALLSAIAAHGSAGGGERLNRAGRWLGFGWSDGYHACQSSHTGLVSDLPPLSYAETRSAAQRPSVVAPAASGQWMRNTPFATGLTFPVVDSDAWVPLGDAMLGQTALDRNWEDEGGGCLDLEPPAAPEGLTAPRAAGSLHRELLPVPDQGDQGHRGGDQRSIEARPSEKAPAERAPLPAQQDDAAGQPYAAVPSDWIAMPILDQRPQRLPATTKSQSQLRR